MALNSYGDLFILALIYKKASNSNVLYHIWLGIFPRYNRALVGVQGR
ncbi:MAG: hypothetical protein ACI86M_002732 [Saprospiraceae bacterium]|jgi:hypothetical protein